MKLNFCAVCGTTEMLEHHHFNPKSLGGSDKENNILTLCSKHHGEFHGQKDRIHSGNLLFESIYGISQKEARDMILKELTPKYPLINKKDLSKIVGISVSSISNLLKDTICIIPYYKKPKTSWEDMSPVKRNHSSETNRKYRRYLNRYNDWCNKLEIEPWPCSEDNLINFVKEKQYSKKSSNALISIISTENAKRGHGRLSMSEKIKQFRASL